MKGQRWKGIMKCYPFEEKRLEKWKPPYIVQPKFDGDRCVNEPLENTSVLLTSEENPYFSVPHINIQLEQSGLYRLPLDGELYHHGYFQVGGHEFIHSICSRTVNLHPKHKDMEYWIFDLKIPDTPQIERLKLLNSLGKLPPNIKMAPYWVCESLDDIKRIYDDIIKKGFEGIIIRHLHAPYVEKRSTFVMKFKPKRQDTYLIVGWNEEISIDGTPKGRIGSLILESQIGDTFAVSAGLNDEDRETLWGLRDHLAGHKAIVHYNI